MLCGSRKAGRDTVVNFKVHQLNAGDCNSNVLSSAHFLKAYFAILITPSVTDVKMLVLVDLRLWMRSAFQPTSHTHKSCLPVCGCCVPSRLQFSENSRPPVEIPLSHMIFESSIYHTFDQIESILISRNWDLKVSESPDYLWSSYCISISAVDSCFFFHDCRILGLHTIRAYQRHSQHLKFTLCKLDMI